MIVDSSVWINYFNGARTQEVDRLEEALDRRLIVLGDLILTEVLQGFRADGDFEAAKLALGRFPIVSMVGPGIAVQAAQNYRTLRGRGVTVRKTIDVLIATYCIETDEDLLFSDRDFQPCVDHLGLRPA